MHVCPEPAATGSEHVKVDHFRRLAASSRTVVAGLAVALVFPFAPAAGAAPGAGHGIAAVPGFTLSVVHEFPQALQETPKFLALSKDGNLYGATSAVGSSNGTVLRVS